MLKSLTLVISAQNDPNLLARTVLVLHRLAIPIHGLTMQRPKGSARMRVTIDVLAEPQASNRIAANLAKLVHVVSIKTRQSKRNKSE
jgi:acetolactate synthase small subunit